MRAQRVHPSPRPRFPVPVEPDRHVIRKEDAACCAATRDEFGRYCIGYCSPTCERRPK